VRGIGGGVATILVIDDDAKLRQMLRRALDDMGHESLAAADGAEGLELFARYAPPLVITDILMPNKEGIETIRELRRADPGVKILAISGSGLMGGADFLSAAKKLGADDALYKPLRPAELEAHIRELLARERTEAG